MSLFKSFNAVLDKHQQALASATALEKASKVISQISEVVIKAGYKSVDAFYAEVEAIAAGKTPTIAKKTKGKGPKAPAAPKSKKSTKGGTKKRFTDEDRAQWKAVYLGEAKGNLSEAVRVLKKQGVKVSYQTLFNTAKAGKWSAEVSASATS